MKHIIITVPEYAQNGLLDVAQDLADNHHHSHTVERETSVVVPQKHTCVDVLTIEADESTELELSTWARTVASQISHNMDVDGSVHWHVIESHVSGGE